MRELHRFLASPTVAAAVLHDDEDGVSGLAFYKAFTSDPVRSLCTRVVMRALCTPYVSFLIDRLDTAGCDVYGDLALDPAYQRLMTCLPEFRDGHAHWSVTRRIGGSTASLWIREQHIDKVAGLNEFLRTTQNMPLVALRIRHTVAQRHRGGRVDRGKCITLTLDPGTPSTAAVPRPPRPNQVTTVNSASGLSAVSGMTNAPYAACVLEGLKRSAAASQSASADHRPHKQQQPVTHARAAARTHSAARSTPPGRSESQTRQSDRLQDTLAGSPSPPSRLPSTGASAPAPTVMPQSDTASNRQLAALQAEVGRYRDEARQLHVKLDQLVSLHSQPSQHTAPHGAMASLQASMQEWMQQQMHAMQEQLQSFIQLQQQQWVQSQQQLHLTQHHWQHQQQQHMQHSVTPEAHVGVSLSSPALPIHGVPNPMPPAPQQHQVNYIQWVHPQRAQQIGHSVPKTSVASSVNTGSVALPNTALAVPASNGTAVAHG